MTSADFPGSAGRWFALDGLRGIAILLVLFYHVWTGISGQHVYRGDNFLLAWLYAGNTGVTLFFVLSGFLVSRPFFAARRRGESYSIRHYAVQRALRILPAYLVVALFAVVVTGNYGAIIDVLMFTARAYDVGIYSAVWWSLATEVQFYVLFPIVFLLAHRGGSVAIGVGIFVVAFYLEATFRWGVPSILDFSFDTWSVVTFSLPCQLPAFVAGIVVQAMQERRMEINSPVALLIISLLLAGLSVLLMASVRAQPVVFMLRNPWYVLPESLVWAGIMFVVLRAKGGLPRVLSVPVLRYFGRISFSLYLVHLPVTAWIKLNIDGAGDIALSVMSLSISVLLAWCLWRFVEKPGLAFKQRIASLWVSRGIPVTRPLNASRIPPSSCP